MDKGHIEHRTQTRVVQCMMLLPRCCTRQRCMVWGCCPQMHTHCLQDIACMMSQSRARTTPRRTQLGLRLLWDTQSQADMLCMTRFRSHCTTLESMHAPPSELYLDTQIPQDTAYTWLTQSWSTTPRYR